MGKSNFTEDFKRDAVPQTDITYIRTHEGFVERLGGGEGRRYSALHVVHVAVGPLKALPSGT